MKRTRRVRISLICSSDEVERIQDFLLDKYSGIVELTKKVQPGEENNMKLTCVVDVSIQKTVKELYKMFQKQEGIGSVSIREYMEGIS